MTTERSRAAIYVRISEDREGDRAGVIRQRKDCQTLADLREYNVVEVCEDNDIGAWSGSRQRPGYRRVTELAASGAIQLIITWHVDRLTRSVRELEDLLDLCERHGIAVVAVQGGEMDLATEGGQMVARMLGAVAKYESGIKARRQRAKARELALAGKPSGGGSRAYGYEKDGVTVVEAEAEVIREAARRVLAGESMRSVLVDFNARGVPTVSGAKWSSQVLGRILGSARIAGQREHSPRSRRDEDARRHAGGEIVADAIWPAIVTTAESQRLRAMLAGRHDGAHVTSPRNLLSNILTCSWCGAGLYSGTPTASGHRRYVCAKLPQRGCGRTAILREPTDVYVAEMVKEALCSPALIRRLSGLSEEAETRLRAELSTVQSALEELARDLAAGRLTKGEWQAAREVYNARRVSAETALRAATADAALAGLSADREVFDAQWAELPVSRQRALVQLVLESVVVRPAVRGRKAFDPTRLDPVWRV